MRVLAIDTATRPGSIAVLEGDHVEWAGHLIGGSQNARALADAVHEAVGQGIEAMEGFAISIGPGSFTGLRVGLSFLKGVSLAVSRPVACVSTLGAMAEALRRARVLETSNLAAVIDARNHEVFARIEGHELLSDCLVSRQSLVDDLRMRRSGTLVDLGALGDLPEGWTRVSPEDLAPLAVLVGQLGTSILKKGLGVDVLDVEPAYLQGSPVDRTRSVNWRTPPR